MTMPTTTELSGYVPKPLGLSRHEGRTILVRKDSRGERLDLRHERDLVRNRIAGGLR